MVRLAGSDSFETRKLILTEATRIFEEFGYQKTSMRMVQEKTNLSKGTLYYHFKNKDDLFISCVSQIYDAALKKWNETNLTTKSATEKLLLWNDLNLIEIKRPIISSLIDYVRLSKEHSVEIKQILHQELELVRTILTEGVENGEFREDINIENASVTLMNFFTLAHDASIYGYTSFNDQKTLNKESIQLLLQGLKKNNLL